MDMSLHIWSWLRVICIALRPFSSRRMDPRAAEESARDGKASRTIRVSDGGSSHRGDKGDPKVLLKAGLALRLTECQTGHIGSCHADL
jgi:hypothetical protein